MKRIFLSLCTFASCVCSPAQTMQSFKLWPDDNASDAEIFVHYPSASDSLSPAILICPGGGYEWLSIDHEGHDMAKWYASQGFVAVVLKYRLPRGNHTIPLSDAEKAIAFIRDNAGKWNVDTHKTGVVGSSAGGHLAASLSNLAAPQNRPDFAVLYYPVISFDDSITHKGSKNNLLGKNSDDATLVNRYSLEKQVDDNTPPTFLLLSDDDKVVLPANSIRYYSALKNKNIPASLYVFPAGGHGWGFQPNFLYHEESKTLILKWLEEIKIK